jgi:hypothetical protein
MNANRAQTLHAMKLFAVEFVNFKTIAISIAVTLTDSSVDSSALGALTNTTAAANVSATTRSPPEDCVDSADGSAKLLTNLRGCETSRFRHTHSFFARGGHAYFRREVSFFLSAVPYAEGDDVAARWPASVPASP